MGRCLVFTVCLLAGCAGEPFMRPPLPVLRNVKPQALRESFQARLPDDLRSDDSMVIRAPFRDDMTLLDRLEVDRPKDVFRLTAFTPFGLMAFDVAADKGAFTINSAVAQFMEHKDLLLSITRDIRQMYLDLLPGASAKATVRPTEVLFSQKTPDGMVSFEFGYDPPLLLEKRLSGFFGTIWRVRYYDYQVGSEGKVHPRGIVLDNSQYHYRIVVRENVQ
jgi:hypothetical protein